VDAYWNCVQELIQQNDMYGFNEDCITFKFKAETGEDNRSSLIGGLFNQPLYLVLARKSATKNAMGR